MGGRFSRSRLRSRLRESQPFDFGSEMATRELDDLWNTKYDRKGTGYISGTRCHDLLEQVRHFFIENSAGHLREQDSEGLSKRLLDELYETYTSQVPINFDLARDLVVSLAEHVLPEQLDLRDALLSTSMNERIEQRESQRRDGASKLKSPRASVSSVLSARSFECSWIRFSPLELRQLESRLLGEDSLMLDTVNIRSCGFLTHTMTQFLSALIKRNFPLKRLDMTRNTISAVNQKLLLQLVTLSSSTLEYLFLPTLNTTTMASLFHLIAEKCPLLKSLELAIDKRGDGQPKVDFSALVPLLQYSKLNELRIDGEEIDEHSIITALSKTRFLCVLVANIPEISAPYCLLASENTSLVSGPRKIRPLLLRNRLQARWHPYSHFLFPKVTQQKALYCYWVVEQVGAFPKGVMFHIVRMYVLLMSNPFDDMRKLRADLRKAITDVDDRRWHHLRESF